MSTGHPQRVTEALRRLSRPRSTHKRGHDDPANAFVPPAELSVVLRWAFPDDDVAIARLAALDSAVVPAPPVLVAEVEGHPRAALSLTSGALIGDPFRPTAALGELLRLRGRQLRAAGASAVGRR